MKVVRNASDNFTLKTSEAETYMIYTGLRHFKEYCKKEDINNPILNDITNIFETMLNIPQVLRD